ncbi:MAG: hypothetical protein H6529_08270 [Nocardioides sp.]|nr:hypothetical protein [Nocardioidaceae bacterium]MCB8956463.1 hypothetical protein [Nocardioides sp.]
MALLVHHSGGRGDPTRTGTVLRALLTLLLVTAVIAAGAGLAAYAVSRVLVSLMS